MEKSLKRLSIFFILKSTVHHLAQVLLIIATTPFHTNYGVPMTSNEKQSREDVITLTGIVIPSAWDELGSPKEFVLSTYEENELVIDLKNRAGRKVAQYLQRKIRVTGSIEEMHDKKKTIKIESFISDDLADVKRST